jgi:hypothetical protein
MRAAQARLPRGGNSADAWRKPVNEAATHVGTRHGCGSMSLAIELTSGLEERRQLVDFEGAHGLSS